MVILNDRTPIHGHDPDTILQQLMALRPSCLLLDFQRPAVDCTLALTEILVRELPCPVGISHIYGKELNCPVFLPPVPPDAALEEYLDPWLGREIWLEAALEGITYTLTENGSTASPLLHPPQDGLAEDSLHCHYKIEATDNTAQIHLYRTPEDLQNLLEKAKNHGITKAVGLYQEFQHINRRGGS